MRTMLIAALGVLIALAVAGCSGTAPVARDTAATAPAEGSTVTQSVSVDGGDVYEECFELKAGQSMDYEFSADGELRYNLHWHNDANRVEYAVKKIGVSSDKGTFASDKDEYYCLMWRNESDMPVALSLTCVIK